MEHSDHKQDPSFVYTYSAKQNKEIQQIRSKYIPPEENKMEQLRRLDRSAERSGTIAAILLGITGTLLLGIGLCCALVWTHFFVPGIVVGVLGLAGIGIAYPVYLRLTKTQRQKLAPQIIKLADELAGNNG